MLLPLFRLSITVLLTMALLASPAFAEREKGGFRAQFCLRTLMLLVTVVAVGSTYKHYRDESFRIAELTKNSGTGYDRSHSDLKRWMSIDSLSDPIPSRPLHKGEIALLEWVARNDTHAAVRSLAEKLLGKTPIGFEDRYPLLAQVIGGKGIPGYDPAGKEAANFAALRSLVASGGPDEGQRELLEFIEDKSDTHSFPSLVGQHAGQISRIDSLLRLAKPEEDPRRWRLNAIAALSPESPPQAFDEMLRSTSPLTGPSSEEAKALVRLGKDAILTAAKRKHLDLARAALSGLSADPEKYQAAVGAMLSEKPVTAEFLSAIPVSALNAVHQKKLKKLAFQFDDHPYLVRLAYESLPPSKESADELLGRLQKPGKGADFEVTRVEIAQQLGRQGEHAKAMLPALEAFALKNAKVHDNLHNAIWDAICRIDPTPANFDRAADAVEGDDYFFRRIESWNPKQAERLQKRHERQKIRAFESSRVGQDQDGPPPP